MGKKRQRELSVPEPNIGCPIAKRINQLHIESSNRFSRPNVSDSEDMASTSNLCGADSYQLLIHRDHKPIIPTPPKSSQLLNTPISGVTNSDQNGILNYNKHLYSIENTNLRMPESNICDEYTNNLYSVAHCSSDFSSEINCNTLKYNCNGLEMCNFNHSSNNINYIPSTSNHLNYGLDVKHCLSNIPRDYTNRVNSIELYSQFAGIPDYLPKPAEILSNNNQVLINSEVMACCDPYSPELNPQENPFYYEINECLYYAHMESLMRDKDLIK